MHLVDECEADTVGDVADLVNSGVALNCEILSVVAVLDTEAGRHDNGKQQRTASG